MYGILRRAVADHRAPPPGSKRVAGDPRCRAKPAGPTPGCFRRSCEELSGIRIRDVARGRIDEGGAARHCRPPDAEGPRAIGLCERLLLGSRRRRARLPRSRRLAPIVRSYFCEAPSPSSLMPYWCGGLEAVEIILEHEVDRARDRVRAIDRGSAAGDDVNAPDKACRGCSRGRRRRPSWRDETAAVDQSQRARRPRPRRLAVRTPAPPPLFTEPVLPRPSCGNWFHCARALTRCPKA